MHRRRIAADEYLISILTDAQEMITDYGDRVKNVKPHF